MSKLKILFFALELFLLRRVVLIEFMQMNHQIILKRRNNYQTPKKTHFMLMGNLQMDGLFKNLQVVWKYHIFTKMVLN